MSPVGARRGLGDPLTPMAVGTPAPLVPEPPGAPGAVRRSGEVPGLSDELRPPEVPGRRQPEPPGLSDELWPPDGRQYPGGGGRHERVLVYV